MPHVDHSDRTPSSGDTCWRSYRQACRRRLLHASRQQGQPAPLPPARNRDNKATSRSADLGLTVLEPSCRLSPTVLVQTPGDPHKLATAPQLLPVIARSSPTATLAAEAATAEAPTMGPTGGPVAEAITAAEATRIATPPEPHRAATTPARRLKNCGGGSPPP
jgi:hypothetical protein